MQLAQASKGDDATTQHRDNANPEEKISPKVRHSGSPFDAKPEATSHEEPAAGELGKLLACRFLEVLQIFHVHPHRLLIAREVNDQPMCVASSSGEMTVGRSSLIPSPTIANPPGLPDSPAHDPAAGRRSHHPLAPDVPGRWGGSTDIEQPRDNRHDNGERHADGQQQAEETGVVAVHGSFSQMILPLLVTPANFHPALKKHHPHTGTPRCIVGLTFRGSTYV